jgi:hypothetical protein
MGHTNFLFVVAWSIIQVLLLLLGRKDGQAWLVLSHIGYLTNNNDLKTYSKYNVDSNL